MPARGFIAIALAVTAVLPAAGSARADAAVAPSSVTASESPADMRLPRPRPTPRVRRLLEVATEGRQQLAALRLELAGTRDHARVLELERRLEAVKVETDLRLFRLQATFAREDGAVDVAERFEAAILRMTARTAALPAGESPAQAP